MYYKSIKGNITMNRKIFFIITTLTFSYCIRENTLEPELNPGRRDYVWTVDTLDIYSPAYKIWGSSPTDVWTINRSDQNHSIWHYDGNKWSTDGIYRSVSPHAIWGFSEKDIFIGGTSGSIWHFDGSNWQHLITLIKDGQDYVAVGHIWGGSKNELYSVNPNFNGVYSTPFKKEAEVKLDCPDCLNYNNGKYLDKMLCVDCKHHMM